MKYLLIVLSLFAVGSCSQKKEASSDPLAYISDTTAIPIDRKTEPYSRTMQYLDGDLYWWNADRETISVLDLSAKNLKKTIRIERDGPNGVGKPLGFFVWNADSIYIPSMAFELNLINGQGDWVADYDYYSHSRLGDITASMTRYSKMAGSDQDNKLFFNIPDLEHLSAEALNEKALQDYPPILSFDKKQGRFQYLSFTVPPSLLKFNDFIDFGVASTTNSLLLLHYKSNTLIEIDFDGTEFKELSLDSELVRNFLNEYYQSPRMSMSVEENMKVLYKSAENFGLAFDPHKNFLYRFGWPGEEIPEETDPMDFSSSPPYFVISVYDGADFSLLKEFTLPRNTYLAHHYFVDEKGLNLFPMHPENPDFDEDQMVIHTFDFSGLR